jgi:hypothetical protein
MFDDRVTKLLALRIERTGGLPVPFRRGSTLSKALGIAG